ncbi:MAG TPA: AAA family ATPase [Terracidiphilus sp.]|nr:AAA family ATPase [Terracidiphilus sp.]
MTTAIRFDDSLPAFAALVRETWGHSSLEKNLFLRDASGRLTFVLLSDSKTPAERSQLASRAQDELGAYVDKGGFAVATPEELFDDTLTSLAAALRLSVRHKLFEGYVYLVDRRIVGADWLRTPEPSAGAPARIVFSSLKGGVGRSTALCVVAADLASKGRRVLAIDMDLEAPGLGNLLLPNDTLPEFGLLDYLVELESGNPLEDEFYADIIGHSWLGGGRGRVDVIPAIGHRSLSYPMNVLAKLARAYFAGPTANGESLTFSERMRNLVKRFADPLRYDAILIDARAGLHETTAAAVLGLGAEVLLFGQDQPQTYAGYELLFAHLGILPREKGDDWRGRFHIVQSKAPVNPALRSTFAERMSNLAAKYLVRPSDVPNVDIDPTSLRDVFEVDWSEDDSDSVESLLEEEETIPVIAVLEDEQFRIFDPISDRNILLEGEYSEFFGDLLNLAKAIVDAFANLENNK